MRPLLLLALLSCSAALALEQTTVDYGHIAITADRQEKDGDLVRCRGKVEIATGNTLVRADEADFHSDTGEIELRGNVRVKLLAAAPKNYLNSRLPESSRPDRIEIERRFRRILSLPEIWK
jgi:lipopolysaccharide assembly outer membrane protein LptD (OstA)